MQRLFMTERGDPVSAVTAVEAKHIMERISSRGVLGITEIVESAARSAIDPIYELLGRTSGDGGVLVVAGSGYTGAVALTTARHLANHGTDVTVYAVETDALPETDRRRVSLQGTAVEYRPGPGDIYEEITQRGGEYELVIDALLGGGVYESHSDSVTAMLGALAAVDEARETAGRPRVASFQIPSGVDPTTGVPGDIAVTADMTIAFALPRTGLGAKECGSISVADVGIPPEAYHKDATVTYPCRFRGEFVLRLRSLA